MLPRSDRTAVLNLPVRVALREVGRDAKLVVFQASIPASNVPFFLNYRTRTGAILRIGGAIAGGFDREHSCVRIGASSEQRIFELRVERAALPTSGLPSGPDIRWWWMLARSHPEPCAVATLTPDTSATSDAIRLHEAGLSLWGHSHLDVAWLWTYGETRRKAVRTFANALELLESDAEFSFIQSQPQLYAFVEEDEPEFFTRVSARVNEGRFDPDVAALWVEPDCNIPSGESLLRQMLHAYRFCVERFGVEPGIAWLPDSFGFARTLPTLLQHAGIQYFATTKLQWNDTTRFAHPQFRWRGPDGSEVIGALIASYDGSADSRRVAVANERCEPLVVGYGDGGGGPTLAQVAQARRAGEWQRPRIFFEALQARRDGLPVHDDELYLEYHRGVYTTHHAIKAENASLERALLDAEERVSWCLAVRAAPDIVERLRGGLDRAWTIVLRNQFHDVLTGTSIHAVYDDVRAEYAQAQELIGTVVASTRSILPRASRHERFTECTEPEADGDEFVFDNGVVRARIDATGALTELRAAGGTNLCVRANLLAAYRDRPRRWEAWNIDAAYVAHRLFVKAQGSRLEEGGLEFHFLIGKSAATMRVSLNAGEPFLRVDLTVDWRERQTLLRIENWLSANSQGVRYGVPHGSIERSARRDTPRDRARFEVPGARYAFASDPSGGLAMLVLDTYGWSARALRKGGLQLGHSLLRSTTWPDALADAGLLQCSWAFAPLDCDSTGAIERMWERYACEPRVRLFRCDDEAVAIAACKPAQDGRGVIVRVRECDGTSRGIRLRCGARMRDAYPVDALERPLGERANIEGEEIVAEVPAYGLRSFRVIF